jgi:hypothetical protein
MDVLMGNEIGYIIHGRKQETFHPLDSLVAGSYQQLYMHVVSLNVDAGKSTENRAF